jgi:hypothetical protein
MFLMPPKPPTSANQSGEEQHGQKIAETVAAAGN